MGILGQIGSLKVDASIGERGDPYRIDRPDLRPFMVVTRSSSNFFGKIGFFQEICQHSIIDRVVSFLDENFIPQRMKLLKGTGTIVQEIATPIIWLSEGTFRFDHQLGNA